ncbi:MAG TPA: PhoPQ-activated protein PqaA family protein [Candidatus Binatia bacterium]|nr:PhoPQ-activated protein PqaA family protein [Candidatus Binatia bacterium]
MHHIFPLAAILLGLSTPGPQTLRAASADPLAAYVDAADDSFAWKQIERRTVEGLTATRLELTSQTWRGNVWRHQILVVRPPEIRHPDIAFLFITGDGDVEKQFSLLRTLALRGGALAAAINRVPNQPLYDGRKEDALIAYTFDQYVKTGDPTWPLLFPMAKSAVRGMDAVQAFAGKEFAQKPARFVVSGASKRGWTTWLSAAVDPRVKAIAPMVIDMLNMKTQAHWTEQMYGRQSEQVRDYTDLNLIARMDEPRMVELRQWVDPYSYRTRYKIPKLLLLGTNDPYWVVDSLRNYWADLPEPKLVFQTPNAGHDLAGGHQATQTLAAFFQMIADGQQLPQMTWQFHPDSTNSVTLEATVNPPAKSFRLWTADSRERDFRKARWSSVELHSDSGTHVLGNVQTPPEGFRACLLEAELATATGQTYKLSTEARVTPDGPPPLALNRPKSK